SRHDVASAFWLDCMQCSMGHQPCDGKNPDGGICPLAGFLDAVCVGPDCGPGGPSHFPHAIGPILKSPRFDCCSKEPSLDNDHGSRYIFWLGHLSVPGFVSFH